MAAPWLFWMASSSGIAWAEDPTPSTEAAETSGTEGSTAAQEQPGLEDQPADSDPASPGEIALPYGEDGDDHQARAMLEARGLLRSYSERAVTALVGRVLTSRLEWGDSGNEVVSLQVMEVLRGEESFVKDVLIPTHLSDGSVNGARPRVVQDYLVLVFLDESDVLLGGNAMFVVEGGYAWRNRRQGQFLRPSADHFWIENIDPFRDYIALEMNEVRLVMRVGIKRAERIRRRTLRQLQRRR